MPTITTVVDVTKTSKKEAKQRRKKEEEGGGSGGGGEGLNMFDGGKALAFAFCGWNECRSGPRSEVEL